MSAIQVRSSSAQVRPERQIRPLTVLLVCGFKFDPRRLVEQHLADGQTSQLGVPQAGQDERLVHQRPFPPGPLQLAALGR
ncbi:hypothetical protein [Limnoglobus roseus]|uniref:hypothetical protein n=1 Tax=Limnoglobus roseus TaxID=2598579 RepID=UPI0011EACD1E|nr:hypothetical protein [Limnoglobus roseus]